MYQVPGIYREHLFLFQINETVAEEINPTTWFKLNDGNYLPHECRLHYLLKCHIFSTNTTAMNIGRG